MHSQVIAASMKKHKNSKTLFIGRPACTVVSLKIYHIQKRSSVEMTFIQKLKAKSGAVAVINSLKSIIGEFKSFKPTVSIPAGAKECFDFVLLFATNRAKLLLLETIPAGAININSGLFRLSTLLVHECLR
jgi:hypothetical protein